MRTLTGAPSETINHYSLVNADDEDQLFNLLAQKLEHGAILQTFML